MTTIGCYIDGNFEPGNGPAFTSSNPSSDETVANGQFADEQQIERAIAAAKAASREWRQTPAEMRAAWLSAIADEIEARGDELADDETNDTGMLLKLTREGHVPRAVQCFRYFATFCTQAETALPIDDAYMTIVRREALGTIAVIAPWNAPLAIAAMNVAAALAVGNSVILKPSEKAMLTSQKLAAIMASVELPPGVFQVLSGDGHVGQQLASSEGIDGLCFVGGLKAGQEVMIAGAKQLKRLTLELGGKSPTILFADCDFDAAVDGALLSAFSSNGEVCAAGSRILVEQAIYPKFVEAIAARARNIKVGDPRDPQSEMGPLIDRAHLTRVDFMVQSALAEGAVAAAAGRVTSDSPGSYYRPVVLDRVSPAMSVFREEIFGPVTAVTPFNSEKEIAILANDTPYGLHASIWSSDTERALRLASDIDAGSVAINAGLVRDIRAPFGGRKLSGLGRTGGQWSIDRFSEPKAITLATAPYQLPRLGKEASADANGLD